MIKKDMLTSNKLDDPISARILQEHLPHGTSLKTIVHLGQLIHFKNFGYYDWFDTNVNLTIYGQENAPIIDVYNHSHVPNLIFAGK